MSWHVHFQMKIHEFFRRENVWLQCTNKCLLLFLPSCQFAKFILLQQSIFLRSVKALLVAPFTFQLLLLHPYLLSIFLPHNWVRKMKRHLSFSDVQLLSCRIITGMCPKGRWRQKKCTFVTANFLSMSRFCHPTLLLIKRVFLPLWMSSNSNWISISGK